MSNSMKLTFASTVRTGTAQYTELSSVQAVSQLNAPNATGYEIIKAKEKAVRPFYDFDFTAKGDIDQATSDAVMLGLNDKLVQFYKAHGVADPQVVFATNFRKVAEGMKLSMHLFVHNCSIYNTSFAFYHFAGVKHVDDVINKFPGLFVKYNKDQLFDLCMYNDTEHKFRVLGAVKEDNNEKLPFVCSRVIEGGIVQSSQFTLQDFEDCLATCMHPQGQTLYDLDFTAMNLADKAKAPKPRNRIVAPPSELQNVDLEEEEEAPVPVQTQPNKKYKHMPWEDFKKLMNRLPDRYKDNRQTWFEVISAVAGAMHEFKYSKATVYKFLVEWSKCQAYPELDDNGEEQIMACLDAAFERVHKVGWLFEQISKKSGLCDVTEDEIVETRFADIDRQLGRYDAKALAVHLFGCLRMLSDDNINIYLRGASGFASQKIKDMFVNCYKDVRLECDDGPKKVREVFDAVINSEYFRLHNKFSSKQFAPYSPLKPIPAESGIWNTFRGWPYKLLPVTPETSAQPSYFTQHLLERVFDDEASAKYYYNWLAYCIQFPARKATCQILYSKEQGTGKSSMEKMFRKLFGEHAVSTVNDMEHQMLGQFNGLVEDKLMIVCNELHAESKSITNIEKFKDYITNDRLTVEIKQKEQREINFCAKFLITTNNLDAIKFDHQNRRFNLLGVSDRLKDDTVYWDDFYARLEDSEQVARFFTELATYPVSTSAANKIMMSKTQQGALAANLTYAVRFMLKALAAHPAGTVLEKPTGIWFSEYDMYCRCNNYKVTSSIGFGRELSAWNTAARTVVTQRKSGSSRLNAIDRDAFLEHVKAVLKTPVDPYENDDIVY